MSSRKWTPAEARAWYDQQPWMVGCNFIPSTAINQLEMWSPESFDVETIQRELGWAAKLGFNSVRVYLHDLAWLEDPSGYKSRINKFLDIAAGLNIRVMLVLFDDCWNPEPKTGPQPEPMIGVHNSGWLQSPGIVVVRNTGEWSRLEDYVKDIVSTYAADERVAVWDVYNEPGNYFMTTWWLAGLRRTLRQLTLLLPHLLLPIPSLALLRQTCAWVRSCHPSQPLTVGLWYIQPGLGSRLNRHFLDLSDVISFHDYHDLKTTQATIAALKQHKRPLFCTEYLARTHQNDFRTQLPLYKKNKISCFNWGLVAGKTQTIYSWEDQGKEQEPQIWYHDILRQDGSPYDLGEVEFLRQTLLE